MFKIIIKWNIQETLKKVQNEVEKNWEYNLI